MKCALIIPTWVPEDIFPAKTAGSQINYWQPLGTLYVAAALLKAGHEVEFLNGAFMAKAQILARIKTFKPDVAGLYATTFGWPKACSTAADIKRIDPAIFTCVGGPYPIAAQQDCLHDAARDIDAVVTGEAEFTMVDLLAALTKGDSLAEVPGIIFRQGKDITCNPARPLLEELDTLPFPARHLLAEHDDYLPPPATYRRSPVAVMITSRGCSRRCIFCFQIDRDRKCGVHGIRFRSVANVLQEIQRCLDQGYREIKFIDDSFAADYARAMQITKAITERGLDFTWFASACVNQVDRPLLQAMKDAGCWAILLGAESGVQKNLNTLRKGTTLEQIRCAVRTAQDVGLHVSTPFIFGIPGETYDDGLKTIEFALELKPDLANFHAMTAFPGTHLYEHRAQYGTVSDRLADFTYQGGSFVPHSMSREELMQLRQIALRRFYSRPSFLFKKLTEVRSWHDCKVAAQGIKSLCALWTSKQLFQERKTGMPTE